MKSKKRSRVFLQLWAALLAAVVWLAPVEGLVPSAEAKPVAGKSGKTGKAKAKNAKKVVKAGAGKRKTQVTKAKGAGRGKSLQARGGKGRAAVRSVARVLPMPTDPLKLPLAASVAYVIDVDSDSVLLGKNDDDVRPIASLTKLMTGLILMEARLPLGEQITISDEDVDRLKFSSSRLRVGTTLSRGQALHLTLMSSENRAAHALARTYPGGVSAFVSAMNVKAQQLGMHQTHYVDPTGLSSQNRSSARDLAVLAEAAYERPLLRKYSTSRGYELEVPGRDLQYVNSNRLVRNGQWNIGLQKTGYISEAGQCLVVQTKVKGRNLIMVLLDSASKVSRIRDAEIVRRWVREHADFDAPEAKGAGGA